MTVDASTATNQMISRLESVYQDHLPTYCDDRETQKYPLPAPDPQHLIVSKGDASVDLSSLGSPNEALSIRYGKTSYQARQTGDGTKEKYQALTDVGISLISRVQGGLDLPYRNGRELTPQEWERTRAEMYRGALMDIGTEHVADGSVIYLSLLDNASAFPPFEIENQGTFVMAQVGLQIYQNVNVPVPHS